MKTFLLVCIGLFFIIGGFMMLNSSDTSFIENWIVVSQTAQEALPKNVPAGVAVTESVPTVATDDYQERSYTTIDLSGQGLSKAPVYIFDKTNTQVLNLSQNNLDGALQAEIRHLQKLYALDLSDNQFTGVPAEIGQLKKLEVLDLSNNALTGLPYELGNLSKLKVLNLTGNAYSTADLEVIKKSLPSVTVIQVD